MMKSDISDGCSQSRRESLARLSDKTNLLSFGECLRKDLRSGKMMEPSPLNAHSSLINRKGKQLRLLIFFFFYTAEIFCLDFIGSPEIAEISGKWKKQIEV